MSKRHQHPQHAETWLIHLREMRPTMDDHLVHTAIHLYDGKNPLLLEKGLCIADILLQLGLDNETLASALTYPLLQTHEIDQDKILEFLGESCSTMLQDLLQMQAIGKLQQRGQRSHQQVENLRKMFLSMVTDARAVLIVLAERLWQLRQAKKIAPEEQKKLAQETLDIFAPLANRLGVWQMKWEIEDLCLRYLKPAIYTEIAKSIDARRDDRETYTQRVIAILTALLKQSHIQHFEVTGRVKHIYSIYNKMLRKNANLQAIYDLSAFRVLVDTIEDCYAVLSIFQSTWEQITEEFDNYISNPKPNGYRSIHTVLIGPENNIIEVQIRTYQMHHESELGVAAHWRYKEGILHTSTYEAKIALLRQVIAWQKEVAPMETTNAEEPTTDLFADRVYVFTPMGDILDLPTGATPLDFAYYIHSEVGHRCRGAKVNGKIVPLSYQLQTGERIEILTAKQANPSRDWLHPEYGYLKTSRARAKAQHWFRVRDSIPQSENQEALEKPLKKPATAAKTRETQTSQPLAQIQISGINNLLLHIAKCCQPTAEDAIVGYITRNRGVSIHRVTCSNLLHMREDCHERLISVLWNPTK